MRWTILKAATEFGISRETLRKRLTAAEIPPAKDYSTKEICRAVFGDIDSEKLRLVREQADKLELENAQTRGDLIPIGPLADTLNRALGGIKAKIQGIIRLEQKERDEICAICERAYRAAFEAGRSDHAGTQAAAETDGK